MALVVNPAARHALAQVQFFEQILHIDRSIAWHGQVVRAEWARDAVDRTAPAVATGFRLQFQQGKVVYAFEAQCPRRGQSGNATACNDDAGFVHFGRRRPRLSLTQQVPTLVRQASEATLDFLKPLTPDEQTPKR